MTYRFAVGAVLALVSASALFAQPQAQQAKGGQQQQQAQQPAAPKGPAPKSAEEAQALQAIFQGVQTQTPDADTRIKGMQDFIVKYPDSDFKGLVLYVEAQTYQQKGDYEHMIVAGEQCLDTNPDPTVKVQTMLMLASSIAQKTREFDLDKQEKLARVAKYTNDSLELLKTMEKPNPAVPDEAWANAKADMTAQAYEAQGMAAMANKDYDTAVKQFQLSAATAKTPDQATQVRLAAVYNLQGKHDDAIATLDKVLADTTLNPQVRQIAQAERARAIQAKNKAAGAEEKK
jgi:tetratricopeptide (TPR) repeat protein